VLVGGKSLRLGRDKSLEPLGTSNLLERVLSRLHLFKSEIIAVAHAGQDMTQPGAFRNLRIVCDELPERGPLGGIFTGLNASTTLYNIVVAGDMPFLNVDLLGYMVRSARGFDVAVPRIGNYFEPLHAVYSRNCIKPIGIMLSEGELLTRKLFDSIKVRYILKNEIERFDPEHLSFFNVNTEEDLKKAGEILNRISSSDFHDAQRKYREAA
jgi:molybdenum cofactor guanylyltransferase